MDDGLTVKIGCCSWSYHRVMETGRVDFAEWLRICAEDLRVGGVDIIATQLPKRTARYALDVKKRCTDYQLTISALSPSNDFGRPTVRERQAQVDDVTRWIETAFILGAPCLRIFAGWPPQGRETDLWAPMVACVRKVAKTAAQAGVTLVVEPHDQGGFLPDSRRTLRLIEELHSPWVRVNLDVGNYHEADLYGGLEASMPYAPHVVAKISRLNSQGEEPTLDYAKIFAMLSRHHYRGFVTVEYEGEADELQAVPRAVAMLRRYAATYRM